MLKQHLLLKFDPQRSLAGLAVGHAAKKLSDLRAELPEHVLAAGQRNAADKMQTVTLWGHSNHPARIVPQARMQSVQSVAVSALNVSDSGGFFGTKSRERLAGRAPRLRRQRTLRVHVVQQRDKLVCP
jgi:hypothetical protein